MSVILVEQDWSAIVSTVDVPTPSGGKPDRDSKRRCERDDLVKELKIFRIWFGQIGNVRFLDRFG
jgi:hypothetical protein